MEYTTHNNEAIETTGLTAQGIIETNKSELVSLFGEPIGSNFVVKFSDGSRALLYPSSADHWYVEGTSKQSMTNMQITLDLHREQTHEKSQDPIEKAFESAQTIMDSIKAIKGEKYGWMLELALLVRKEQELINVLTATAVKADLLPEVAFLALGKSSSMISAKIISLGARLGEIDTDKFGAEELMEWTDKMMEAESSGMKDLISEMEQKDNDA